MHAVYFYSHVEVFQVNTISIVQMYNWVKYSQVIIFYLNENTLTLRLQILDSTVNRIQKNTAIFCPIIYSNFKVETGGSFET